MFSFVLVSLYFKFILLLRYSILGFFDHDVADSVILHLVFYLGDKYWFFACVLQLCNRHDFNASITLHLGV